MRMRTGILLARWLLRIERRNLMPKLDAVSLLSTLDGAELDNLKELAGKVGALSNEHRAVVAALAGAGQKPRAAQRIAPKPAKAAKRAKKAAKAPQVRACKTCGEVGHNSRTCPQNKTEEVAAEA